ncbi:MAG: hypothetical protein QOF48_1798 [Verrucomicrobiota bacterium]|jgi:hypothetical protein
MSYPNARRYLPLAILLSLGVTARADVVTLNPAHDATLIEIAPNRNNGAEQWFMAGTTQNGTRNRGLLQFDFTGIIPANAIITSVDLSLEVTRVPGCGLVSSQFSLHQMLTSWGEGAKFAVDNQGGQGDDATAGEVTWNRRFVGGAAWGAPGGLEDVDFAAVSSGLLNIYGTGDSPYHFVDAQMALDVQNWVNNPAANFGWMLMTDAENTPFTARRFGSHEDANVSPILTVYFEVVPEPGMIGLGVLMLTITGVSGWRVQQSRARH